MAQVERHPPVVIVAILGAGGHGADLAAIARACGFGVEFYDDETGTPCDLVSEPYVVGVNDPATRRDLTRYADNVASALLVHPAAVVDRHADLGPGVVIGAGTQVGPRTQLGAHVHIGAGCTLTRTTVGAFTTIAPGVDIAGDVTIGEECLIGVGATVSNLVTIGDRCVVGAGAVVVRDVPSDTTVAGVPAKPLQRKGDEA